MDYCEAYKEWIRMFNDDLVETWKRERGELQKAGMLLSALQNEFKYVQATLEIKLINIRQQLEQRDLLEETKGSPSPSQSSKKKKSSINKENESNLKLAVSGAIALQKTSEKKSPDLFRNLDINSQQSPDTSVIDLSRSDDDATKITGSPTIKRRKKYPRRYRLASPGVRFDANNDSKNKVNTPKYETYADNRINRNIFKTPVLKLDNDLSVIENTPEVKPQSFNSASKIRQSKSKRRLKNRNTSNTTLTQMFSRSKKKLPTDKTKDEVDSDETYFDNSVAESELGITDMLSYINKDDSAKPKKTSAILNRADNPDMDSSSEDIDQFSKGAIFNESDIATSNEKPKAVPLEPEPAIRGKARKQLQGWACEKCKKFYSSKKLSAEELQKKLDECSRHRYKYRPPEETLPGFWDLSIPSEKPV